MAWLMFKEADTYKYRGKKVSGFQNQIRPKINLSWGMDALQHPPLYQHSQKSPPKSSSFGAIYKRSEQEELNKILKKYNKGDDPQQQKDEQDPDQKNQQLEKSERNRLGTQSSAEKIRYLENSLLPASRRDTMGFLLNQDLGPQFQLSESRVSRRSSSGNKKNESTVELGDGYSVFRAKEQIEKDFHQRLMDRYNYQQNKKTRRVSQVQL